MKKIFLLLPLIFVLSFLTCEKEPDPPPPPPTLDQRLVGVGGIFLIFFSMTDLVT